MQWTGIVRGDMLLGGTREHRSAPFKTREQASDWLETVVETNILHGRTITDSRVAVSAFPWHPDSHGAGFIADMPEQVTLCAYPEHTTGVLGNKPRRGTQWRIGASIWNAAAQSIDRYGRDTYRDRFPNAKAAKAAAEALYNETL